VDCAYVEFSINAMGSKETIADGREQKGRPYVFDDVIVARIIQVHTEQLEDHWLFEE
jgi:hypothetical protein